MNAALSNELIDDLNSQLKVLHFRATPDYINNLFSEESVKKKHDECVWRRCVL